MVKYYALLYGYEDELANIKGNSTTSYYAKAKEW
jgi:hypothetical protein